MKMKELGILAKLTSAVAVFDTETRKLLSFNNAFQAMTRIKKRPSPSQNSSDGSFFEDFFSSQDNGVALSLFLIAKQIGNAYDFERNLRRFPHGNFPGELRLTAAVLQKQSVIVFEVQDLSVSKLYLETQLANESLREKIAALMEAQAEIQHNERLQILSQIVEDIADKLLNPLLVCRSALSERVALGDDHELTKLLSSIDEVKEAVVWLRQLGHAKPDTLAPLAIQKILNVTLKLYKAPLDKSGIQHNLRQTIEMLDSEPMKSRVTAPEHFISFFNAVLERICAKNSNLKEVRFSYETRGNISFVFLIELMAVRTAEDSNGPLLNLYAPEPPAGVTCQSKFTISNQFGNQVGKQVIKILVTDPGNTDYKEDSVYEENDLEPKKQLRISPTNGTIQTKRGTVLLVDDDPDIRKFLRHSLQKKGHTTQESANGKEALDFLQHSDPKDIQLVVCDVRMPKMNGPAFLLEFRKQFLTVPFVFFSAHNLKDLSGDFKDDNVYFLTKDQDPNILIDLVTRLVTEKHQPLLKSG